METNQKRQRERKKREKREDKLARRIERSRAKREQAVSPALPDSGLAVPLVQPQVLP